MQAVAFDFRVIRRANEGVHVHVTKKISLKPLMLISF